MKVSLQVCILWWEFVAKVDIDYEHCADWQTWSTAMGVSSKGGSWIIDLIVYLVFSVSNELRVARVALTLFRLYSLRLPAS